MSKPEIVFKAGAVRASVFNNSFEKDGKVVPLRKVAIEVRYKGKDGLWHGSNSLSLNELPKAITALQQAYEYLLSTTNSDSQSSEMQGNTQSPEPDDELPQDQSGPGTYPRVVATKRF